MSAARADRLVEVLAERELDMLVVTDLLNLRYLTGFTGTNGACVVGGDERVFFTDFRYVEQASEQVTDFEGEFVQELHKTPDYADGLILNPGAWTHYSWALRDALEIAGLPAVEVHLSAVDEREEWRRTSVIRDLCIGCVQGKGVEGYREALELLRARLR